MPTDASPPGRVCAVSRCDLRVVDTPWPFALDNKDAIETHWRRRVAENPKFFNGRIFLGRSFAISDRRLAATLAPVEFASFLYWHESGLPADASYDLFGSALVRSSEGHVMLGVQDAGNVNSGRAYLPGGFIDDRDARPDRTVDIDASIARELAEETGLTVADLKREPGYLVSAADRHVSIAAVFRAPVGSGDLIARIRAHIARDADSELADVLAVPVGADLGARHVPFHARQLIDWLRSRRDMP